MHTTDITLHSFTEKSKTMYLKQTDSVGFASHLCTVLSPVGDANFYPAYQLASWSFVIENLGA